jgi:GTP cyclohydrolase I
MKDSKRYLVEVGMKNLPFPMHVASRAMPDGQPTVGNISVTTHIAREFEASWIDKFIQLVHLHRENIGTKSLKKNVQDYLEEFNDAPIKITFEYPFFVEKLTPVTKEKCLVRYACAYSLKASSIQSPKITFSVDVPVVTTFPESTLAPGSRPFGQLSIVTIEVESHDEVFPEDIIDIVDRHALAPMYSFLAPSDQDFIIGRIRKETKSSVVMVDEIKEELSRRPELTWYAVRCANFGMLHSYSTYVATEKSSWVPMSSYAEDLETESAL